MTRTLVVYINALTKTVEGGYWALFNAGQYHSKISDCLSRAELGAAIVAKGTPCVFLQV